MPLFAAGTSRQTVRAALRRGQRTTCAERRLADFGCAIVGVFAAVQLRFGKRRHRHLCRLEPRPARALDGAVWLAGGYDVRFIGTGSDEFRKVLNAGVGLTAAIALFSYVINIELSRALRADSPARYHAMSTWSPGHASVSGCTGSAHAGAAC